MISYPMLQGLEELKQCYLIDEKLLKLLKGFQDGSIIDPKFSTRDDFLLYK